MINFFLIVFAVVSISILLSKKIRDSSSWRATVTPLASIIGSGFLVIVPLLGHGFGAYAPFAMLLIVVLAYEVGGAIRYNIQYAEPIQEKNASNQILYYRVETLASIALGIAYIISVAFYLRLLSSFALRGFGTENDFYAKIITTGVLIFIGLSGWIRGLGFLERLEEYSVSIKLAIIGSLIVGWSLYDSSFASLDQILSLVPKDFDVIHGARTLAGALIVVQGFETSRYLGESYGQKVRIKTMQRAQLISGVIYIIFVSLTVPTFPLLSSKIDDTAIIGLSVVVASALPVMLVIAALMSQFSAAVADTIGAGGLIANNLRGKFHFKSEEAYALITALAVILVWLANIFEIIALASRAFAFYYALQCLIATVVSWNRVEGKSKAKSFYFAALTVLLFMVTIFAIPAD